MTYDSEHFMTMRPSIWTSVAVCGGLAIALLAVVPAPAQINGPPTSVTSPGFGGHPINGPRSSVTSVGPLGYAPPTRGWDGRSWDGHAWDGGQHGGRDGHHGDGDRDGHRGDGDRDGRRRHHNNDYTGSSWYAVPYAYYPDYPQYAVEGDRNDEDSADDEPDYQGGPTVLDRRGSGERSYVPPAKDAPAAHAPMRPTERDEAPAVDPDPPLAATTLVFKDGHTVEVANYAIQGSTLFDLTSGHRRRIPLKELDLEATRKQNDEHGVSFELPMSIKAN